MIVMPANSSGWFWHCLARETGKLGHLFSPGAQRGPWPWFPYALDNGAFSAWNPKDNTFNEAKWSEYDWKCLLTWACSQKQKPRWAIVPDRPGCSQQTIEKWSQYAGIVKENGVALALAVQNGMTPAIVRTLNPIPDVIAVGGSTDWKWDTIEMWAKEFPRVHLLRCNAPDKLRYLEDLGVESCDGTGWSRGDRTQTRGLEAWARREPAPRFDLLADYVCRQPKDKEQMFFA